ncbi:hypothetical protein Ocin01_14685 [Orchesella cincta]|uniref:Uncharacterized protein n=1 Tax=Orchesella cincta TaxID=48709 RepID=A0A1D2MG62_ORCCI|nr:hypothetical protein Ocin01_14685 [Orchesella cincta]
MLTNRKVGQKGTTTCGVVLVIFIVLSRVECFQKSAARKLKLKDTISITLHQRNYLTGPVEDIFQVSNHDSIAVYVGPPNPEFPVVTKDKPGQTSTESPSDINAETKIEANGKVRMWALIDHEIPAACELQAIHNYGEMAFFACHKPGLYRAYVYDRTLEGTGGSGTDIKYARTDYFYPTVSLMGEDPVLIWNTLGHRDIYDMLSFQFNPEMFSGNLKIKSMNPTLWERSPTDLTQIVVSDPILIEHSDNCYYWMYQVFEGPKSGYVGEEVVPSVGVNNTAYKIVDVLVWIAEHSGVPVEETSGTTEQTRISDYSKMLTNRFQVLGLAPCLRKTHPAIEILKVNMDSQDVIEFFPKTHQYNRLDSPYWRAKLKIHTDRLITTLSDVTFTISSRQNVALFGCFVGDTRAFISLRNFEFVPRRKLDRTDLNLKLSNLEDAFLLSVQYQIKHIYGHGVQYVGNKMSKLYQPGTARTDLVIVNNPCIAQEFALAVGGLIYVSEGLLTEGMKQLKSVILPGVDNTAGRSNDPIDHRDFLRVFDMAFTPTHLVVLFSDGVVMSHPSSAKAKGVARLSSTEKYRPSSFVQRGACGRTATPKLSNMIVPAFGTDGSIIIIQLYPIEGSVSMWIESLPGTCSPEGAGFVGKADNISKSLNETEIHFNEYVAINRSNERGLHILTPPPRAEPAPHVVDLNEEYSFLINNDGLSVGDNSDPHFPIDLTNPASHVLGSDWTNYNQEVVYVLDAPNLGRIPKLLIRQGLEGVSSALAQTEIVDVAFTPVERKFIVAARFQSEEINKNPFQLLITTVSSTNFPFKVKLSKDSRIVDEVLDTIIPFPGMVLIRPKSFQIPFTNSRDPLEEEENTAELKGKTMVDFLPKLFPINTAVTSFVIHLGNVFVVSSLDGRYARPLHYFSWSTIDVKSSPSSISTNKTTVLQFQESSIIFNGVDNKNLHDAVVSEQGIISVLWRKASRHLVQDNEKCVKTDDSPAPQSIAIGSVVVLEGLREVRPFFQNDNIFQMVTPDGEIVYGKYDVKPHSPFPSCHTADGGASLNDDELCIEQPSVEKTANNITLLKVCANDVRAPCRDPGYLNPCRTPHPEKACLRLNRLKTAPFKCQDVARYTKDPKRYTSEPGCDEEATDVTRCFPDYFPRDELRSISLLGTSFNGYLHGSLKAIRSMHPEAQVSPPTGASNDSAGNEDELDVCPFNSFTLHNREFDYAEVGFATRLTGEISYHGEAVPSEADLIVEFEPSIGVIVEVSSFVVEDRGLTTIRKVIDISFRLTDYQFEDLRASENLDTANQDLDFDEVRAREKSTVFSITLKPAIVNLRCKNTDFFKTTQFNVGCNTFSRLQLIAETAPFYRINVTDSKLVWEFHPESNEIWLPAKQVNHHQVNRLPGCNKTYCKIPHYNLYKSDRAINYNLFGVSYRDLFFPKFEQFLTVSTRRVTGNVILYDLLGSKEFNVSVNNLNAGCFSTGGFWYDSLLNTSSYIGRGTSPHENVYKYYENCFDESDESSREFPYQLSTTFFYLFNLSNHNSIKFKRQRNQIFVFRAVVLNTDYNRFTYCRTLETFFFLRVTGIPIPRQALKIWHYFLIVLFVAVCFFLSYLFFHTFYTWKLDEGANVRARSNAANENTDLR